MKQQVGSARSVRTGEYAQEGDELFRCPDTTTQGICLDMYADVESQRRVQEGSTFVLTDIPGNAAVHVLKGTTVVEIIVVLATAMMRLIHLRSTR